jgi:hypothetical protein
MNEVMPDAHPRKERPAMDSGKYVWATLQDSDHD